MEINLKELRIGEIHTMKCGYTIEIIDYKNAKDVTVKFLETDEVIEGVCYGNIKKKNLKSHFSPTVYGWEIIGTDKYSIKILSILTGKTQKELKAIKEGKMDELQEA